MPEVKNTTPTTPPSQALSITALVTGIVGLVFVWVPFLNFILGALGIVFGALGIRKGVSKGLAIAGLVTGCVTVALTLLFFLIFVIAAANAANYGTGYTY